MQAWFRSNELEVRPGETVSLSLAIENAGDTTDTYTITAAGINAAWVHVSRTGITLFEGSTDIVEVTVHPPLIASTSAGPTTVAVRVMPHSDPDTAVVAETVVEVASFDDRRISLLQPLQRARRRARYEFLVENHGNSLANTRLHLVDLTDRVDGSFDPPAIGVAPGASSLVRLNARARGGRFRRRERQLDFTIEATEPDHLAAIGQATIIQPATIPLRVIGRVLGVVGVAGLVWAAWALVVRPEIDDAVERAVAEQGTGASVPVADESATDAVSSTLSASSDGSADTTTEQAPTVLGTSGADGDPAAYRIAVEVGVTQERSQSLLVPPDADFHLTDIVLQNPGGDAGNAWLLRNDEVLYEWDLGGMNSANEFQPRVTALPFAAGDSIVLQVRCDAVGDPTGTSCDIAVLITGELVS